MLETSPSACSLRVLFSCLDYTTLLTITACSQNAPSAQAYASDTTTTNGSSFSPGLCQLSPTPPCLARPCLAEPHHASPHPAMPHPTQPHLTKPHHALPDFCKLRDHEPPELRTEITYAKPASILKNLLNRPFGYLLIQDKSQYSLTSLRLVKFFTELLGPHSGKRPVPAYLFAPRLAI